MRVDELTRFVPEASTSVSAHAMNSATKAASCGEEKTS